MGITDKMTFKVQPWAHQLEGINKMVSEGDYGLFWEPGTGKTLAAINALRALYSLNRGMKRTLILCPLVVIPNWVKEILKFSNIPLSKIYALNVTGKKRKTLLEEAVKGSSIIILNYEGIAPTKTNSVVFDLLKKWQPEILIADESHKCKNPKAKRTRAVVELAKKTDHNFLLTGTPILNDIRDLFAQFRILDRGVTLGTNFNVFVASWMYDENAAFRNSSHYFPKWAPIKSNYPRLKKLIQRSTMVAKKKDCLDLPPLLEIKIEVPLSPEQQKMYDDMKRDFVATVNADENKHIIAEVALTKALRLMQICTGILSCHGEEESFLSNIPRLEIVEELLEKLVIENKVILWCTFKANYKQLGNLCKKMKIPHVFLTGAQNGKQKQESIESFNNNPDTKVIIANRRAGGIGVNLIAAGYSIVYSRNTSMEEEHQSKARNYRGGSEIHNKVVKYDLCSSGTVDEVALQALLEKKKVADAVINYARKDG